MKTNRIQTYTTEIISNKDYPLRVDVNEYVISKFREEVDLLIESMAMYQKYDSITIDFTKDERR